MSLTLSRNTPLDFGQIEETPPLFRDVIGVPLPSPRLPPELFRPIVEYVTDFRTLYNLSLTCRTTSYDAERQLYSHAITDADPDAESTSLHIAFLTTINRNSRLASYVREYHCEGIVRYGENPLWSLLYKGLRRMVNLRAFFFKTFDGHPAAELLIGVPFRLEKLVWRCHSDEDDLWLVLCEQQEMKELQMNCSEEKVRLFRQESVGEKREQVDICPKLDVLKGNRYTIEGLMPGRRIKKLAWIPGLEDMNFGPVSGIEMELASLKTFSLGGYFNRPSLELFSGQLENIEVLELLGLHPHELALLRQLPSLKELVFSPTGRRREFPIPINGRKEFVEQLFIDLPKLDCIDIAHDWIKSGEIRYERWTKLFNLSTTEILPMSDVRSGRF